MPPFFCASAITCSASVVLPELSGPKISMMRPRGRPPMPRAISRPSEPVEMDSTWAIGALAELHHRALAEIALDLAQRCSQRLVLIHGTLDNPKRCGCCSHVESPLFHAPCRRESVRCMYALCSHFVSKSSRGKVEVRTSGLSGVWRWRIKATHMAEAIEKALGPTMRLSSAMHERGRRRPDGARLPYSLPILGLIRKA